MNAAKHIKNDLLSDITRPFQSFPFHSNNNNKNKNTSEPLIMDILTEKNNEYEVKIIDCATNQPFKEYVKLADRESHGDSKCERYIVARPGDKFKIEITLMSRFRFKPLKQVYGEDIVGAPFIFSSLDVDEDLSNETDIVGLNPADIGNFSVTVYRRTVEKEAIKISTKPPTHLRDAKKVDQLNFKKHVVTSSNELGKNKIPTVGLHASDLICTNSTVLEFQYKYRTFEFLDHLDIVLYPPPLYYTPLEVTCAYRAAMGSERTTESKQSSSAVYCHHRRQSAFMKLQKDQKVFERGEVKQQMSSVPANKIIVLDDDGTAPQPTHPSALAEIKCEAQDPPNAIRQEIETSYEVLTQNSGPSITQKRKIKMEHGDRDDVDLSAEEPLAKRRKIKQEPIDMNMINNVKIKQEPIDLDTLDEKAMVLKDATIKYDLTELEDAVVLP
ncbi:hypothetical protein BPAE_0408g00020 [Botrytis paeoniae]|uniref:DUF7918 domain-containing protein n=1 Tax=Botrytis paeoniae TaxID=278948 RepID=A0A4Z1EZT0_9HELO|nr:hypothetical protein BPAE_0408g00020 [Botrytis paeoniae]